VLCRDDGVTTSSSRGGFYARLDPEFSTTGRRTGGIVRRWALPASVPARRPP